MPQSSTPDEDARRLGLTAVAVDPQATAAQIGLTVTEDPASALAKASSIGPVPMSAKVAEHLPIVGGAVGGFLGGVPGAFAGGMLGKRVEEYVNALTGYRQLPSQTDALKDMGVAGLEQGGMEVGGKMIGKVLSGPLRPTAAADIELARANKELGLRLSPSEMIDKTKAGIIGKKIDSVAERSLAGRVIGDLNRQITQRVAKEGIVKGKAALNQVGEALHEVVTKGPTYDMLPHRVQAANIFANEVAPKILDLYAKKLSPELVRQLQLVTSTAGAHVSPDVVQALLPKIRRVIQRGQTAPVPTGTIDALETILQTADTASFEAVTNLRTSLLEIGRKGRDSVLGERGKVLTGQFAGDLTQGLSDAYPAWDPLRELYAVGSEAQKLPYVSKARTAMQAEGPRAYRESVRTAGKTIAKGDEAHVLQNLRTINDALGRVREKGGVFGDRVYNAFEIATTAGLLYRYGPEAAAGSLAVTELLPGLFVWAAHNPVMTKLLQEGITTRDTRKALTLLGRVTDAYLTAAGDQDKPTAGASQ